MCTICLAFYFNTVPLKCVWNKEAQHQQWGYPGTWRVACGSAVVSAWGLEQRWMYSVKGTPKPLHVHTHSNQVENMQVCTLFCGSLFAREFRSQPSSKWHIHETSVCLHSTSTCFWPKAPFPFSLSNVDLSLMERSLKVKTSLGFVWNCEKVWTPLLVASGSWPSLTGRSRSLLKTGASWRSEPAQDLVAIVSRILCDDHVRRQN